MLVRNPLHFFCSDECIKIANEPKVTMPEPETIGVLVWRLLTGNLDTVDDIGIISESATYLHEHAAKEAEFDGWDAEPGVWLPLDAASLASVRETVAEIVRDACGGHITNVEDRNYADAILAALGLVTPGEHDTQGALANTSEPATTPVERNA